MAGGAVPAPGFPFSILNLLSSFLIGFAISAAAAEVPPDIVCVSNGVFRPLFR